MYKEDLQSSITLCNVPIDYTNQRDFNSLQEQQAYFNAHATWEWLDCKYTPRTGKIKVKGYVEKLNDSNYGYYTNYYHDNAKRYYFFIASKQLIAKETTELTVVIDVFQTWLFDYNLEPCFVEREHVSDDEIGHNTKKEDFDCGSYVVAQQKFVDKLGGNPAFIVGYTDQDNIGGGVYGKTYSGLSYKIYKYADHGQIKDFIQEMCDNGKADGISCIFQYPENLINMENLNTGDDIGGYEGVISFDERFPSMRKMFGFHDIYTPYNNKLYCYPYNFITIHNPNGDNVVLKYEDFFDVENMQYKIESVLTPNPVISLTPISYGNENYSYKNSITLQSYGLCSWNNDNYANWYANHKNSITNQSANATNSFNANAKVNANNYANAKENVNTNMMTNLLNGGLSGVNALGNGNIIGAGMSGANTMLNASINASQQNRNIENDLQNKNLLNTTTYQNEINSIMASVEDSKVQPNTARGDTTSCGLDVARDTATFIIEQTQIKAEYARSIDMFFQMYGYKVATVKVPNTRNRKHWNYVKTVNCRIVGNIPADDKGAIEDMYNNGLTIWHDDDFNYNKKNDII